MKRFFSLVLLLISISFSVVAQDAKALYDEGVKLKGDRQTSQALEKFKQAVQINPDYTEALYEMGWCMNDTKDYYGAIRNLRKVVQTWTTIPKAHFELAYAFEKSNSMDSAMFYYNKTLALKSDYSLVYKQLGFLAYQKDDYVTALDNFSKYEMYTKVPISDYLYWYRKGFSMNAQKDYPGAKTALTKSLEFKKDYTSTYLELGFAATKLKQADEAIEYYKKAIELEPKSHIGYNGIGEVYRDVKKDMPEAMSWYQKSLAMNVNERKANFGVGYCLNSTGKYNEAIVYLQRAIDNEDTYTAAYVELGYSYYMIGNNTEGLKNLDKALKLNPKNENSRYYKGLIYISQKDKANAQKMVSELEGLNSKNASTLRDKVNQL